MQRVSYLLLSLSARRTAPNVPHRQRGSPQTLCAQRASSMMMSAITSSAGMTGLTLQWTAAAPSRTPSLRRQYKQYKQEKSGRAPQKHAAIPGQFQRAAEQQRRKRLAQAPLSQQPQNGESSRRGRFHHRPQNAQVRASPCAGNELTAKRNAVTSPRATQAPLSPRIRSASGSMRRLRSHCRPCRSCPAGQIS